MKSPAAQRATNITSLVLCGILAGIVVAAAAFPLVGSVGLSAKAASESFEDLPGDLKAGPPPLTSKVYDAKGGLITTFFDENREDIPFAKIPKVMQDAIIAAEDHRFWTHKGTDPKGIVRAFVSNIVSSDTGSQGGSTLTQQYVKQALYYSAKTKEERDAAIAPTGARKVQELKYAVSLEKKLSKQDIMQRYLNIANFGNGNYGVSAAARGYFNKTPDKLTVAEAALLASTVKNPSKFNPVKGDKESAKTRRDFIIRAMGDLDLVKDDEADAAIEQPITLNVQKPRRKCENGNIKYGFYCGWFLDWWKANPQFGKTVDEREENLYKGGYSIGTALDPKIQAAAQESIDSKLPRNSKYALGIVVVEPGTGQVKAMAVNRTYGLEGAEDHGAAAERWRQHRRLPGRIDVQDVHDGGRPGEGHAAEHGDPLARAIPVKIRRRKLRHCRRTRRKAMTGTQTMWSAFGESANTYFVQLEERVSVKAAVQAAEKLGVVLRDTEEDQEQRAAAFKERHRVGRFHARRRPDHPARHGECLRHRRGARHVLRTDTAAPDHRQGRQGPPVLGQEVQAGDQQGGRGRGRGRRALPGRRRRGGRVHAPRRWSHCVAGRRRYPGPVAGKSGTTDGKNGTPTAWLVGFTPTLAAAAFVANPKKADDSVDHLTRRPADIFIDTMKVAVENAPKKQFVRPTDAMAFGVRVTVPDVEGDTVEEAKSILTEAGFTPIVEERKVGSRHPAGTVARTDPDGGSRSNKGGAVTIFVSNGTDRDDEDPDKPGDGDIVIPGFPDNGNGPGREPDGDGDSD